MSILSNLFIGLVATVSLIGSAIAIKEIKKIEIPSYSLESDKVTNPIKEETKLGGVSSNKSNLVADIEENRNWWRNKYEQEIFNKPELVFSTKFSITRGYGTDMQSLNKVCQIAYEKSRGDFEKPSNLKQEGKHDNEIYLENINKYCTKDSTIPLVLPTVPNT